MKKCTGSKYCDCAREAMAAGANREWVEGFNDECPFKAPTKIESQKEETPEKPDFEKYLRDAFGDKANRDNMNVKFVREYHFGEYPDSVQRPLIYKAMERIWRDYVVASKEVPQKKDDQIDGTMQTLG